ncbi:MAG: AmmeMemoRadiSam system protein B [Smithellaceae bacterium]|nr:AmmeMemoRadiSam system protein B [Smithellaceae bacterium]
MSNADIREPAVAGKFYSDSAPKLRSAIEQFLQDALPVKVKKPVAIIVPHAGYIFSGQICADGFKQVSHEKYDVIVILGTNHTNPGFQNISLYPGSGFRTPLGTALIDRSIVSALIKEAPADCTLDTSLHESEHSVEVMVPFIQVIFPEAKIVPAVVGSPDTQMCARFGRALAKVLKNRRALIVTSSDLSHYPSAENADFVDRETLAAVAKLDPGIFQATLKSQANRSIPNLYTSVCGEAPILVTMAAAGALGAARGVVVSYANSGDMSVGDRSRVVGYGTVVFTAEDEDNEKPDAASSRRAAAAVSEDLTPSDKKTLLAFARKTLSRIFTTDTVPLARGFDERLQQPWGVFVTLRKKGDLRGCIGRMIADEPLVKLVGVMSLQAAFNDRRFPQLTADELKDIEIEISVLTPMKQVAGANDIVVGRDGVLLSKDSHSAVFLPQVATEQGWNREQMLDHLCLKAGLTAGSWKKGAKFSTFQAIVFSESQFK